jgi:hypothetical protein
MKAISLWRPWDLFVLLRWKTIETRTHERFKGLVGTTIAIHSAKTVDPAWRTAAAAYLTPEMILQVQRLCLAGGMVHGIVDVRRHGLLCGSRSRASMIDCNEVSRFGLFLANARTLREPIEIRGHQGIFNVSISLKEAADATDKSNYTEVW